MQYIPCNSALLGHKALFLTQKGTVFSNLQKFWDLGRPPPPCWENFPNNVVFFFESVPKEARQKLLSGFFPLREGGTVGEEAT